MYLANHNLDKNPYLLATTTALVSPQHNIPRMNYYEHYLAYLAYYWSSEVENWIIGLRERCLRPNRLAIILSNSAKIVFLRTIGHVNHSFTIIKSMSTFFQAGTCRGML